MDKEDKKKKIEQKKKQQVIKEKDIIKDSDYEDSNEGKKIIIVALILALLIGGFAYVRSLEKNKDNDDPIVEEPIDDEDDDNDEEELPTEEETNNDTENNYQVTPTPSEEVPINIWESLENVPTSVEAGTVMSLPTVTVDDNGTKVEALITYKFRSNIEEEYVTVSSFDTTKIGEYLITYTISFKDGKVETKDLVITVNDTVEPIINNVVDGEYYNSDILLDITEYSPYIVELNGVIYDASKPITEDGEYTLVVTEDKINGKSITVSFVLDKTVPTILGVEDKAYYNSGVVIEVDDDNLLDILLTKDGVEYSFVNGLTNITEDGTYQIVASDKAGNINSYTFVIDNIEPVVEVIYTPNNEELTSENVLVTITSNEALQEVEGWVLSEDKLTLTKEFSENIITTLELKDLAGNPVNVDIVIDYIDHNVSYSPKLIIENLVANKVKATITSLKQLIINDDSWTEIVEDGLYKYEKIYSESVTELVSYEDLEGNTGTIEVKIDIELNDLFVTYQEDPDTQNVTAYVTTEEEVLEVPEGWTIDTEYQEGYRYYKIYTENVDYELVEFVTDSKYYVATIIIDSIDRDAPVATPSVTYITEEEEKKQVVITVPANEVINGIDGWSLSEDKKTLVKIIDKPTVDVPTDELNESITITDLKGNETIISYTYNWN